MLSVWLLGLVQAAAVLAWGATGHEVVATIAQSFLHPDVRTHLCQVLPEYTSYDPHLPNATRHCHLAPVAAWADRIKGHARWSSPLHYVNALGDNPPSACTFGETPFHGDMHVLNGITNYTRQVLAEKGVRRDEALRFLVHFVGDMHQPMHLIGRDRGGNGLRVHFEGHPTMLNRRIRALHNYTEALPDARFESALRGRHFDAYVRWILAEGLGVGTGPVQRRPWWPDWFDWMTCPVEPDRAPNYTDPSGVPVCPLAWARDTHRVGCVYAMAPPIPAAQQYAQAAFRVPHLPDVSAPSYLAPIEAYVLRLMQR